MENLGIYLTLSYTSPKKEEAALILRSFGYDKFLEQNIPHRTEKINSQKIFANFLANFYCVKEQIIKNYNPSLLGNGVSITEKAIANIYSVNRACKVTLDDILREDDNYKAQINNEVLQRIQDIYAQGSETQTRIISEKLVDSFIKRYFNKNRGDNVKQLNEFLLDMKKTTDYSLAEFRQISIYTKQLDKIRIYGDNGKEYLFNDVTKDEYNLKEKLSIKRIKSDIKLSDIAGLSVQKERIDEILQGIRDPETYIQNDVEICTGILFYGPPGTGKTMFAKAIANELNIDFISLKLSELVSKYFGDSERIIQNIFDEAKKNGRTILFIDEIDALVPKRDDSNTCHASIGIVNTINTNLSGIVDNDNIIVIGATNRLDSIDESIIRAGRISNLINIPLPDYEARKKIFNLKIDRSIKKSEENKGDGIFALFDDNEYDNLSNATENMSGADINEILERAKRKKACKESKMKLEGKYDFRKTDIIKCEDILDIIKKYERLPGKTE